MLMKQWLMLMLSLVAAVTTRAQVNGRKPAELLEVRKIWDAGEHNAFTDIVRWRNAWWCTFREADKHVSPAGRIRVITSVDGDKWESAALVEEKDCDLRDPKFSITPDDRLMIVCGASVYTEGHGFRGRQPRVLFSKDGHAWTAPKRILGQGDWLWRVVWHDGKAYGTAYNSNYVKQGDGTPYLVPGPEWSLELYRSDDGVTWEMIAPMEVSGRPNETTIRFLANGDLVAMVRRELGATRVGWIGVAHPPYTRWTWHENNYQFGGPNFIQLPDGSIVAGTRDYTANTPETKKTTTVIGWLAGNDYSFTPFVTLPSGGDNSYPGFVWYEGVLWTSYYSSHEGKTSIYLAKIKLPPAPAAAVK